MKQVRFLKTELTEAQMTLIQEAGKKSGIPVTMNERGDLSICGLSQIQFARIVSAAQDYWGLPFLGVKVQEVRETERSKEQNDVSS